MIRAQNFTSLLVTSKCALVLCKHFPQDFSKRTIQGAPHESGTQHMNRACQFYCSPCYAIMAKGYGRECGSVKGYPCLFKCLQFRMYMFQKCYMGFCTPRRTKIDFKKKKKIMKIGCPESLSMVPRHSMRVALLGHSEPSRHILNNW